MLKRESCLRSPTLPRQGWWQVYLWVKISVSKISPMRTTESQWSYSKSISTAGLHWSYAMNVPVVHVCLLFEYHHWLYLKISIIIDFIEKCSLLAKKCLLSFHTSSHTKSNFLNSNQSHWYLPLCQTLWLGLVKNHKKIRFTSAFQRQNTQEINWF